MKFSIFSFLILCLVFANSPVAYSGEPSPDEEAIASFDVQALMLPDGVLDLRETIEFQARNKQIKHGFYRDLPRNWLRPDGEVALLSYRVIGVTRDGQPEPWQLTWRRGTMRIIVGDKQHQLAHGNYRYQIHYQVSNVFIRDQHSDVLIWNVTGRNWPFTIYKTRFSLQLAQGKTGFDQVDFFTGRYGETLKNGRIATDGSIASIDPFYREDFTVLYRWPSAELANAAPGQTTSLLTHMFIPSITTLTPWLPAVLLALAWGYFWIRRPRFIPCDIPEVAGVSTEFSPGFLRIAAKQTYDDKGFCADIVNLILKGEMALENPADGKSQLRRIHTMCTPRQSASLTDDEHYLMELLFRKGDVIVMNSKYNRTLRRAYKRMEKRYRQRQKGAIYRPNGFLLLGAGALIATLGIAVMGSLGWTPSTVMEDMLSGTFFLIFLLFSSIVLLDRRDAAKPLRNSLIATLSLPLVGYGLVVGIAIAVQGRSMLFSWYMPAGYVSAWAVTAYLTALGYIFLPHFTASGQARYARAEGIVRYLTALDEKARTGRRRKGEPRAPDISLLPWAVAAGLGTEWTRRLTPTLANAITAPEIIRSGAFYNLQLQLSIGAYSSALGRGSSSGGGFSGGGAGGGGGGGW